MDPITIIEGDDLDEFLAQFELGAADVYRVRIFQAKDGNGIKIKINERTWTYWIGKKEDVA
jgi:hypothetical protein